ncbi:MAG: UDP-N-acetylmuramoyl-L-alanyl-D-glutamate--2,6-diaminopimelate ligase [Chloroflexi bacterium HGW-Chloroflexi-10]|nr:MAG: UDP-N-acetylmuramoyl-L-alanyl-D-glutamate--2,6-diaminopimelate ligase [Chloroflexi bacterium HGW-Chloroflexi-10]
MRKKLSEIIHSLPVAWQSSTKDMDIAISGIQYDSRKVKPGDLFVALVGDNLNGHQYIDQAIINGAVAVLGSQPVELWKRIPVAYISVTDTRETMAYCSASFYNFPARNLTVIGVTGTDGKTTTSNMIYQILKEAGVKVGMISTVNAQIGDEVLDTGFHVTTPEAPAVQYYLERMRTSGLTHVVLETTSHGLAQHRVTGCEYDIAVVTNITHEHLDYHGSYAAYRDSKARMFRMLSQTVKKPHGNIRLGVLNCDDQSYPYLKQIPIDRQAAYSIYQKEDIWAEEIQTSTTGSHYFACGKKFRVAVNCHLPGEFNVSNSLAAITATVLGLSCSPEQAAEGIASLQAVSGRMQPIDLGQNFSAIVDFAHTPNALENALKTARAMTSGRVIAIFGSAGLRDRQKRKMMAEVSAQIADITILTAEDPRTESLIGILGEMRLAAEEKGAEYGENLYTVPDRGFAIQKGIEMAQPGDLVIACGKGHEQSMCFGITEFDWDDRTAMRAALAAYLGINGPSMPYLPTQQADWKE